MGKSSIRLKPEVFQKRNVVFTDESPFTNRGTVNSQCDKTWARANPHWVIRIDNQNRWKVLMWMGIVGNRLVGPIFLDDNLNARSYLEMLTNELPPLLENCDVPAADMWWQEDGAPPYKAVAVTTF